MERFTHANRLFRAFSLVNGSPPPTNSESEVRFLRTLGYSQTSASYQENVNVSVYSGS